MGGGRATGRRRRALHAAGAAPARHEDARVDAVEEQRESQDGGLCRYQKGKGGCVWGHVGEQEKDFGYHA